MLTSIINCGMKLFIHYQTSTVQPLKFENKSVNLLITYPFKLNHIKKGHWVCAESSLLKLPIWDVFTRLI